MNVLTQDAKFDNEIVIIYDANDLYLARKFMPDMPALMGRKFADRLRLSAIGYSYWRGAQSGVLVGIFCALIGAWLASTLL